MGARNIHPTSRHVAACPRARTDHDQEPPSLSSDGGQKVGLPVSVPGVRSLFQVVQTPAGV
jgi:hypothetical protein